MLEPGQMGEIVDGHTLRFVRTVKHSRERVWRALTDETELTAWMRYPVRFEARVSGRAFFFGEQERVEGKVFIFDPPRTLAYRLHVSHELAAWAKAAAADARSAVTTGHSDETLAAIDRLELATRQLHRIARQESARPDFWLPDATPVTP
jgi:uncharacterized protein YndB with AHSA1/START domain